MANGDAKKRRVDDVFSDGSSDDDRSETKSKRPRSGSVSASSNAQVKQTKKRKSDDESSSSSSSSDESGDERPRSNRGPAGKSPASQQPNSASRTSSKEPKSSSMNSSQVQSTRLSAPSVIAPAGTPLAQQQLKFCLNQIIKSLKRLKDAGPFLYPVDPVALGIPTYFSIIKHPMDLSTVQSKLEKGEYPTVQEFIDDMELMFNNCLKFNGPGAPVTLLGQSLQRSFRKWLEKVPIELKGNDKKKKVVKPPEPVQPAAEKSRMKREVKPSSRELSVASSPPPSKKSITAKAQNAELRFCASILRELKHKKWSHFNYVFMEPVDAVALGIPTYHEVIKHPMDLSTIQKKLDRKEYGTADDFEADVRLMFNNCYTFNLAGDPVYQLGKELEKVFDEKWKDRPRPAATPAVGSAVKPENSKSKAASSLTAGVSSGPQKKGGDEDAEAGAKLLTKQKKPKQKSQELASAASSESSDSESSSEDEAEENNQHVQALQQQMIAMQSHLAMLMGAQSKKKKKNVALPEGLQMLQMLAGGTPMMPFPMPGLQQPQQPPAKKSKSKSKSHRHHHDSEPPSASSSTVISVPGAALSTSSKSKSSKKSKKDKSSKKKSRSHSSSDEEEPEKPLSLTMAEKLALSEKVGLLSAEKTLELIEIIRESVKDLQMDEELELDIDQMDDETLRKLIRFVDAEVGGVAGAAEAKKEKGHKKAKKTEKAKSKKKKSKKKAHESSDSSSSESDSDDSDSNVSARRASVTSASSAGAATVTEVSKQHQELKPTSAATKNAPKESKKANEKEKGSKLEKSKAALAGAAAKHKAAKEKERSKSMSSSSVAPTAASLQPQAQGDTVPNHSRSTSGPLPTVATAAAAKQGKPSTAAVKPVARAREKKISEPSAMERTASKRAAVDIFSLMDSAWDQAEGLKKKQPTNPNEDRLKRDDSQQPSRDGKDQRQQSHQKSRSVSNRSNWDREEEARKRRDSSRDVPYSPVDRHFDERSVMSDDSTGRSPAFRWPPPASEAEITALKEEERAKRREMKANFPWLDLQKQTLAMAAFDDEFNRELSMNPQYGADLKAERDAFRDLVVKEWNQQNGRKEEVVSLDDKKANGGGGGGVAGRGGLVGALRDRDRSDDMDVVMDEEDSGGVIEVTGNGDGGVERMEEDSTNKVKVTPGLDDMDLDDEEPLGKPAIRKEGQKTLVASPTSMVELAKHDAEEGEMVTNEGKHDPDEGGKDVSSMEGHLAQGVDSKVSRENREVKVDAPSPSTNEMKPVVNGVAAPKKDEVPTTDSTAAMDLTSTTEEVTSSMEEVEKNIDMNGTKSPRGPIEVAEKAELGQSDVDNGTKNKSGWMKPLTTDLNL
ncbi:hypothetical protein HK102_009089 [Quaeritorhiza haematococci]|nr:hypothetical protein HK102_009089 [Quaeritorhiza haematococci]